MNRFEDALREALRREDPGEDFTQRVLAAVPRRREKTAGWRERLVSAFRLPVFRLAAATALGAVLIVSGVEYRQARIRSEGEAAKQQLMLAMRIAGAKLHAAQTKVLEIGQQ